ncbi:MAG: FAD-dependent oxidoreductase [Mangrovibacterium sp.]
MEPVFMILGQSAAVAANMAIDKKTAVQDIPCDELKTALEKRKQILNEKAKVNK